jgi:hypothetical protein
MPCHAMDVPLLIWDLVFQLIVIAVIADVAKQSDSATVEPFI